MAAISVGVVPQQPPTSVAPSSIALRGELGEVLGRRVREDDLAAGQAGEAEIRQRGERQPCVAHLLQRSQARVRPGSVIGTDRVDAELREARGRPARREARQRLAVLVERQQRDDREHRDAAHGGDRRLELAEVVERLDEEQVDASGLEDLRLLGEQRAAVVLRVGEVAERADRAGDQHLPSRDLSRLARDLDAVGVDPLDLVLQEASCELASVRTEGVGLDQLSARIDEAEVEREDALGRADVGFLGQRSRGTAAEMSEPMPPSQQIGGPERRRSTRGFATRPL